MGIPSIVGYPMPAESELPDTVVPWRPDAGRAVLLIHDMQRYFVDFFPPGEPMNTLVRNAVQLRRAAVDLGVPVVYTAQPGGMSPEERGLLRDFWGRGMGTDRHSRQIVEELAPAESDTVLTKWRYSAFHRTGLDEVMRGYGRDQLVICGVYAHVGCLMTACDAFTRDIEPFLVADAVADFSEREHRMALEYTAQRCAATMSTRQVLDSVHADRMAPAP